MRRVFAPVVVVAFLALTSCTSKTSPVRSVTSGRPKVPSSRAPAAASRSSAPEVRMFAGVQSQVGALVVFCTGKVCSEHPATPPRLPIAEGSVVTFAVDAPPDQAVLDVGGAGARRVSLATATLMAFRGRLAPGSHRLTLQLRWGTTAGTWIYDVSVRPKS